MAFTSSMLEAASSDSDGHLAIQRFQYSITVATLVCCSITSDTQTPYAAFPPVCRLQGRSRLLAVYLRAAVSDGSDEQCRRSAPCQ